MSSAAVHGHLIDPKTIRLDEPLGSDQRSIQVHLSTPRRGDARLFVSLVRSFPEGTMTAEEIDREIEEVRGDWER
jgi:hypothetical protein